MCVCVVVVVDDDDDFLFLSFFLLGKGTWTVVTTAVSGKPTSQTAKLQDDRKCQASICQAAIAPSPPSDPPHTHTHTPLTHLPLAENSRKRKGHGCNQRYFVGGKNCSVDLSHSNHVRFPFFFSSF